MLQKAEDHWKTLNSLLERIVVSNTMISKRFLNYYTFIEWFSYGNLRSDSLIVSITFSIRLWSSGFSVYFSTSFSNIGNLVIRCSGAISRSSSWSLEHRGSERQTLNYELKRFWYKKFDIFLSSKLSYKL